MWKPSWYARKDKEDEFAPLSGDPELREIFVRTGIRVAAAFAVIFGMVYFAFWWSGAAIGFGANRAAGQVAPTWHVVGTVCNSVTREPIPWATIEDDPNGQPPFFRADAGYRGSFDLLTLAEQHRLRVSAPGYRSGSVQIGRVWFMWFPKGSERRDVFLQPE
jgi:hypothetical protein